MYNNGFQTKKIGTKDKIFNLICVVSMTERNIFTLLFEHFVSFCNLWLIWKS